MTRVKVGKTETGDKLHIYLGKVTKYGAPKAECGRVLDDSTFMDISNIDSTDVCEKCRQSVDGKIIDEIPIDCRPNLSGAHGRLARQNFKVVTNQAKGEIMNGRIYDAMITVDLKARGRRFMNVYALVDGADVVAFAQCGLDDLDRPQPDRYAWIPINQHNTYVFGSAEIGVDTGMVLHTTKARVC